MLSHQQKCKNQEKHQLKSWRKSKINPHYYCNCVLGVMFGKMHEMSDGDFIFLQDGVRAHNANVWLDYLDKHCSCYILPNY